MIYQQYTSAVKQAYHNRQDAGEQAAAARSCRAWIESLEIDPELLKGLVEQVRALEEAFSDLERKQLRD